MSKNAKIICLILILPLITLIYGIASSQYITVFNSLLTAFCIVGFFVINKKFSLFNNATLYAVIVFILLAVFMGRTLKMYNFFPQWDKILHFTSGFVIASIAKQVYKKIKGDTTNKVLMNWFVFLFAAASASVWEFYEFFVDSLFNMSAQNGLADTMLDMIAGTSSALITIIISNCRKSRSTAKIN